MRCSPFLVASVAVLVSLAVPASALLSCMADHTDSAMTQMACCKTAKPHCGASSKGTMECCKRGDHPDQQNIAKGPMLVNPLKTQFVSTTLSVTDRSLSLTIDRSRPQTTLFAGTTAPPHLVFSVLLI